MVHDATPHDLALWAENENLVIIGMDNLEGSVPLESLELPQRCVLFFGQEGPGLSPEAQSVCTTIAHITQLGSTRSINIAAAAAVAMHAWVRQHVSFTA